MRRALAPLALLLAFGCGAPEVPQPCDATQPGEPCYSDEAFASCLDAVERCGSAQVQVLESCPLQFQCPDDRTQARRER